MSYERVSDEEIGLLLDGELSMEQQADVQARLASDAPRAAHYFAEASRMHAVRSSQRRRDAVPRESVRRAMQLGRRLQQKRRLASLRAPAAAVALVILGWIAGAAPRAEIKANDAQVADENFMLAAREALRVAQLDSGPMRSEPSRTKIERLVGAINISMPSLPQTWTVTDVQVQPWHGTQSLVVTAITPTLGRITLVATSMKGEKAVPLKSADDGRIATVYWQSGGTAYALMSTGEPDRLEKEAKEIEVATRKNLTPKFRG